MELGGISCTDVAAVVVVVEGRVVVLAVELVGVGVVVGTEQNPVFYHLAITNC